MNREIKFEYGFESVNGTVKKVYYLHEIPNIQQKCDVWNVLPIKYVRQSTGLKDKNGTEIFEGDILSLKKEASLYKFCPITIIGFVQYVAGKYEVNTVKCINPNVNNATSVHFGMKVMDWIHLPEFYKSEIIGNIYENPELVGDVI